MRSRLSTILPILALSASLAGAGDLTTDNLTVNKDASFYGSVEARDASSGSAPTNGLLLYYSFDTNTTPIPDGSGNGYTGTVAGATWVTNGATGGAFLFDGNSFITASISNIPTGASARTVSIWFKASSDTDYGIPFYYGSGADNSCYLFRYTPSYGNRRMSVGREGGPDFYPPISATSIETGIWYHAAFSYDGTQARLYINGVLEDATNRVFYTSHTSFYIGQLPGWSPGNWRGNIDEVRLYNRALTAIEVLGLYRNDAHLTAGSVRFEAGITYVKPLGDLSMGTYTNTP